MLKIFSAIRKAFQLNNAGDRSRSRIDYYRRQKETIDDTKLIANYKRFAYACANLNANACAKTQIKLYVQTRQGDPKTRLKTADVKDAKYGFVCDKFNLKKSNLKNLEEVTEHPVLTVLKEGNDSPLANGYLYKLWTFLYLEITGRAYWLIEPGVFNLPIGLWVLPTNLVEPYREPGSKKILDYYKYFGSTQETKYKIDEIIQFLRPDLNNPYINGIGGLEAGYEANNVSNKLISHETNMLDNEARPDAMISPKDKETTLGPEETERYEKEWNLKFRGGRGGGVWIPDEAMELTPINWPPRDIARLEINKQAKEEICNVMDTPIALLEAKQISRETLEAAMTQHAIYSTVPKLNIVQSVLNERLLPLYDETGRLLLCYDNPVPEDREAKMQEGVQFKSNGIWTANEVRDKYGYPPHPDGNKLESQNVAGSGEKERDKKRSSGSSEK